MTPSLSPYHRCLHHMNTLQSAFPKPMQTSSAWLSQKSCFFLAFPYISFWFWSHCHVHFCPLRTQIPIAVLQTGPGRVQAWLQLQLPAFTSKCLPTEVSLFLPDLCLTDPHHSPEVYSLWMFSEWAKPRVTIHCYEPFVRVPSAPLLLWPPQPHAGGQVNQKQGCKISAARFIQPQRQWPLLFLPALQPQEDRPPLTRSTRLTVFLPLYYHGSQLEPLHLLWWFMSGKNPPKFQQFFPKLDKTFLHGKAQQ